MQLVTSKTSGRLAAAFGDLISGIVWATCVSYNWAIVSKVTVDQLSLAKMTQTIPDILALNVSALFSLVSGVGIGSLE